MSSTEHRKSSERRVVRPARVPNTHSRRWRLSIAGACSIACALRAAGAQADDAEVIVQTSEESEPVVVVPGDPLEPGTAQLIPSQVRQLPGAFGDPLRAIEALPGVIPIVSGLPYFFVRGAPPANVGFFLDGVDVPLLYHAFFGPSVIHPATLELVELHAAAPPARYGRFAGPVVAADLRRFRGEFSGEASVRVIDAGALIETPFADGRGDVRLGGRYAYAGLILDLLSDARLAYWDYQALARYRLGRHDEASVFAFGAFDLFEAGSSELERAAGVRTEFHRLDLRWDSRPSPRLNTRLAVTFGSDQTSGDEQAVVDRSLRVRSEIDYHASSALSIELGFDARLDDFELESDPRHNDYFDLVELFPTRSDGTFGAYGALTLRPTPEILIRPGLRADLYTSQGRDVVGIDPRVSSRFRLSPTLSLEHSIGIMHQRPNFIPQVPAAQVGSLEHGLQTAWIQSSSLRVSLPWALTAEAGVFRSAFLNAVDPIGSARDFEIDRRTVEERVTISATGLELKLSRSFSRTLGGFVAYTLSRSEWTRGRLESVSGFDRTHVLQAAIGYGFGGGVHAGVRSVFYTGIPARIIGGNTVRFSGERRGEPFLRVDARVEKRFRLAESGYIAAVAEVLNATAAGEVLKLECGAVCQTTKTGAVVLPSVGVEVGF